MKPASRSTGLAVSLAIVLALAGCAGTSTGLDAEAGEEMQSTVVTAADQAAAGDTTGALATLNTLESQLQNATDAGDISSERAASVREAIDLVRADLLPPAPAPTTEPAAPESPVTEEPATTDPGSGPPGKDKDKDKDKDKGNGNGKNK